ncbi:8-amino-7-oxononanoate synthase [Desmospora profundinema]|uniref:8-amino-7-ketopelargonate synthase n=1 Tax=Desmospora profundinema TaxID=1571184 RepID=A0ABU1IJ26_9BACL|nr:8-amino-7-oxononanoate synthase [Desmospora profundinema]MDR6224775.1 8-amino-7-oxononanoate synthase [Desmospora profundinema]
MMGKPPWMPEIKDELSQLEQAGRIRSLFPTEQGTEPVLFRQGHPMVNLSSNNYLGLASHPTVVQAAARALEERGAGAPSSRLITGHDPAIAELEAALAQWKGTEAALVIGSGYLANLGVLSACLSRRDAVFSDRLNHASIIDGIRLSGATAYRYRHRDMNHLERLLQQADGKGFRQKWIVTDSVFSMDGDVAPLKELADLKEQYGATLMVDEAHGAGVFGPQGKGVAHHLGVADAVDIHMGTFSKAFGVYGAYIAARKEWIDWMLQRCRSFIYTTALPPAVIGGIRASLELVQSGQNLRTALLDHSRWFRRRLQDLGVDTDPFPSPIIPWVIGDDHAASAVSQALQERGVLGVAIRPPTVPEGSARIRFSLMATHRREDLEQAVEAVADITGAFGRESV